MDIKNLILKFEELPTGWQKVDYVREVMGQELGDPEGCEVYRAFAHWVEANYPIIWGVSKFNENDI